MDDVNRKIRNQAQYDRGIWDWTLLQGCFGNTRITPTDIDGCIERHGCFLWIETKRPGAEVPKGQEIVLYQLARRGDTVLIVYGEQGDVRQIVKLAPFGGKVFENADNETLRKLVQDWYEWADGKEDKPLAYRVARMLRDRFGKDYCDTVSAEWVRMEESEKMTGRGSPLDI